MKLSVLLLGISSLWVKLVIATSVESMLQPRGESSPNPVAAMYPDQITGTINSTLSVVPIPYELARSIIPSQYKILTRAYQSLLPGFPKDKYPVCHHPFHEDLSLTKTLVGCQRRVGPWSWGLRVSTTVFRTFRFVAFQIHLVYD